MLWVLILNTKANHHWLGLMERLKSHEEKGVARNIAKKKFGNNAG